MSAQHFMFSVCCVCGAQYGRKACVPAMDGKESHGYCPTHFAEAMAALRSHQAAKEITPESFTPITPPGFVLQASVAGICGLPAHELMGRLRPRAWHEGVDYTTYLPGVGVCIRLASLSALVAELATSEQVPAASCLLAWLSQSAGDGSEAPGGSAAVRSVPPENEEKPWWQRGAMA